MHRSMCSLSLPSNSINSRCSSCRNSNSSISKLRRCHNLRLDNSHHLMVTLSLNLLQHNTGRTLLLRPRSAQRHLVWTKCPWSLPSLSPPTSNDSSKSSRRRNDLQIPLVATRSLKRNSRHSSNNRHNVAKRVQTRTTAAGSCLRLEASEWIHRSPIVDSFKY